MSDAGPDSGSGDPDDESFDVLQAKYHDYCSAQLAELLLYLSPDEIFLIAERATQSPSGEGGGYSEVVEAATEWLARTVALPPFDVWLADYRAHPEDYERYFMGLWEDEIEVPSEG